MLISVAIYQVPPIHQGLELLKLSHLLMQMFESPYS